MVKRILIDTSGIKASRAGVAVDTASEKDLILSIKSAGLQMYQTGTLSLTDYNSFANYPPGPTYRYRRGTLTFGKTFSKPPIVLVCGMYSSSKMDINPLVHVYTADPPGPGDTYICIEPALCWEVSTTTLTVYIGKDISGLECWGSSCDTARYYIFENPTE